MTDATLAAGNKPPAGFYDDGSGRQRWFDGTNWTDQWQGVASPQQQPVQASVQSPFQGETRRSRDRAAYTREQKGHSILFWIFLGGFALWIPAIYYSVSPNHYWHL